MCETKKCSKCGQVKLLEEFYSRAGRKDGKIGLCKSCGSARSREYYLKNRAAILANQAQYYAGHRDAIIAYQAKYNSEHKERIASRQSKYAAEHRKEAAERNALYYERNRDRILAKDTERTSNNRKKVSEAQALRRASEPEKYWAHKLVAAALADGRLESPKACIICNATGRLEYHHEDYSKPLGVIALCCRCHKRLHAGHFMLI